MVHRSRHASVALFVVSLALTLVAGGTGGSQASAQGITMTYSSTSSGTHTFFAGELHQFNLVSSGKTATTLSLTPGVPVTSVIDTITFTVGDDPFAALLGLQAIAQSITVGSESAQLNQLLVGEWRTNGQAKVTFPNSNPVVFDLGPPGVLEVFIISTNRSLNPNTVSTVNFFAEFRLRAPIPPPQPGDLVVIDQISQTLVGVNPTTGAQSVITSDGVLRVSSTPLSVAVEASGNILIGDSNSDAIYRIDPTTGEWR